MKKSIVGKIGLVIMIAIMLLGLLGGCCYYYCPTCPQETHPGNVEEISHRSLLDWIRPFIPMATRWLMANSYDLVSRADIEWALNQIGPWECCMNYDEITDGIHALEGYKYVPVGYVEYSNGTRVNIIICKDGGQKKAFLLINGELKQLIEDSSIIDAVI